MRQKYIHRKITAAICLAALTMTTACGNAASPKEDHAANAAPTPSLQSVAANADPLANDINGLFLTTDDLPFTSSDEYADLPSIYTTISADGSKVDISGKGASVDEDEIVISQEGTYVLTGSYQGSVVVDAEDEDRITLVLDSIEITAEDGPAISIENADAVTISLPSQSKNVLKDAADAAENDEDEEEDEQAVIFASSDLIFNGLGILEIQANAQNGIYGDEEIRILGGNYQITAKKDALIAEDCIAVKNAAFNIDAGETGLKTTNNSENDRGFLYIEDGNYKINAKEDAINAKTAIWIRGGDFYLSAGDDAIHADQTLTVDGGMIDVSESTEGLEAAEIVINSGTITVISSDDGINASGGSELDTSEGASDGYLYINGGSINVNAQGDGLDSNTSIYQTGGDVIVEGSTNDGDGAIDYDNIYQMTGGSLLALGSVGMLQTITADVSTVNSLTVIFDERQSGESHLSLLNNKEESHLTDYTSAKEFQSFTYASADLASDETYRVLVDEDVDLAVKMDSQIVMVDQSGNKTQANGHGGMARGLPPKTEQKGLTQI